MCCVTFTVSLLLATANAQDAGSESPDSDRTSLTRATRVMRKLDRDGNGTFEKSEDPTVWRRYRKLDTNADQILTIDELRKQRAATLDTNGERKLDVVYKQTPQGDLLLDLYFPNRDRNAERPPLPVVVYTHGGGWAAGSKQGVANGSFKLVFERLLDHGFAVASVGYRLVRPNSGTAMRDCVIDAKDAVRYLSKNSKDLNLNPTQFFAMGDSAGGQMAQMLVLSSPESLSGDEELEGVPYKFVAGVSWYGPCDFERTELFNHDDRVDFRDRFGPRILGGNEDADDKLLLYREMSPVNYLGRTSPPFLLIQGDKDTTIPVKHAYYMKQKAEAVDAPIEIMIVRNAGHNWRKVDVDIEPMRAMIVDRTVKFLVDRVPRISQ